MAMILNIDTALEHASVSLSCDSLVLGTLHNTTSRDHAAWLHHAIKQLLSAHETGWTDLDAISVSNGPGSYTGLRIGLATAKGICFANKLPLITISTLEIMTAAVLKRGDGKQIIEADLFCPLIDARRMEVFYAVYDKQLNVVVPPNATILQVDSFIGILTTNKILFFGNGSSKLAGILSHNNAIFDISVAYDASEMSAVSENYFTRKVFSNLAYTEPLYVKGFYSPPM